MATESQAKKRVAIIGAGASGLTGIKSCLDDGLDPVCFDQADDIGGLWYYREDREGQGCVYESTVINTSKEVMCYSDFPIPDDYPNFMHNRMVLKYYHLYCDHFGLRKYIQFKTKVNSVEFADDYDKTGRWKVSVTPQATGKTVVEEYDAVMVCTGHHATPYIPEFEGLKNFKGKVLHTHEYLTPAGFEKKRIVSIGVGNSSCDAAVELGRVASQVYLSTRRGTWVLHRLAEKSVPVDIFGNRRVIGFIPLKIKEMAFTKVISDRVDHKFIGLQPKHSILAAHPTVNDFLPNCIMNGSVIIKPNIEHFTATGVVFEDGTTEDNIDVVLLGTGYSFGFPFLNDSVVKVEQNQLPLYKYVFPPDHKHPTLAFLGYIQPLGAVNPISELQARWVTRIFKGLTQLPSKECMWKDVTKKYEAMARRYVASPRHTIQVDAVPYMDEVAEEFGVKPDFFKMLFSDPILAMHCVFGPFVPYHYRLVGPGKWNGARDAILTVWHRIRKPLLTRKIEDQDRGNSFLMLLAVFVVLVAVYVILF